MDAFRRAQARYDAMEEFHAEEPAPLSAVEEAVQYVREARRAGAPESVFELLVEATPYRRDLATSYGF